MDCPLLILVILDLILTVQSTSIAVQPSPVATVAEGSVLWLTCTYDLDGGTLGQLVWKGNDSGTVATVTPTATPPCSTLYPDAYTPDCSQLSSNEVRLGILTPVHGHTYSCLVQLSNYTLIGPKSTQVDVVVPVPSVTFTPPISDTVTVTPGGSQTYTCVSGNCRPQARIEWYKDGMNVTTHTGSVSSDGDKFVTTSSYTLTGAKGDSPATVQCRASNVDGMTPVQSGVKNFVVQWPPDGPPVISGYTNSSILYVNDTLSLSCRQTGGNPLSTLTWTGVCRGIPDTDGSTGTESVSTIIITVTKGYNQGTCGCVSTHPQPQGQDRSEVIFTVHYNKDELEEHLQSIMRPASDVAATDGTEKKRDAESGQESSAAKKSKKDEQNLLKEEKKKNQAATLAAARAMAERIVKPSFQLPLQEFEDLVQQPHVSESTMQLGQLVPIPTHSQASQPCAPVMQDRTYMFPCTMPPPDMSSRSKVSCALPSPAIKTSAVPPTSTTMMNTASSSAMPPLNYNLHVPQQHLQTLTTSDQSQNLIGCLQMANATLNEMDQDDFQFQMQTAPSNMPGNFPYIDPVPAVTDHSHCNARIAELEERVKFLESNLLREFLRKLSSQVSNSSSSTIRSGPVSVPPASHPQESEDEMLSASLRTPVAVTEQANQMTSPKPTGDSQMIDLYPGSGVKIGSSQLNMCRRKAKDSPTAMARLLLLVFFDQKTLAESCAKGTSKRKALDSKILDAIVYSPTKDPVLTGYTEGQILYEGSPDLSLTCTQEGGNPLSTITWDCEGQTGTPGTGSSTEVTSTVQVPSDRSINRKSCTCTSRSPDTNIIFEKSKTVVFTIYYAPLSAQLPSITGYTSGEVLYEGDPTRSIQCHQAGGFPLATLTWDCFGLSGINMSTQSASVSTIQLPTNRDYNGRNCTCTASHPDSNVIYRRSDYVTVNVHYPPSTPTISGTPTHPWLEGESGTLNCNYVEGFPALTRVEWFRNGRPQIGQLTPSITLTSLTKDENQVGYTCRVKNDFTDVKLTNLTSPVMNLNVEFRPLVTLTPTTLTVVEGQTAQVTCDTEGNPTPRVEWLRGGSSVQTGQGTSLTLTLGDVDRSETDNYTCRAEGVSSVQGRQLITQMMTLIGVQYPPDVTVVAPSGVEEGDTNVQLMCQTLGEPNTLTSQSWTQTIDQTFITDQFTYKTSLHDTIVLAEVSMDDVGMYTCSVSNGVPDRNGQTLQSNSAILDVKVAAKFNNSDENKLFYGELQKPLVVKIPFYSNPPVIYVADIEWTQMTTGQNIIPSGDITFNLHDREGIYLPIKGAKLLLSGQAAVMTIRSFESSFVGDYNVTIYNDGRHRHSTYRFSLTTLSDYPKDPTGFRIMDYTSTTITVEWNKGFNGGHAQTFVIMYGPFGGTSVQTISVLEQQQLTYTKEITGLQPNTRYQLNLYSYNKVGNSSLSSGIGIIGKTQLHSAAVTSNLNTVAIVFFILASLMLLITASLFICIFCRQKLKGITAYKRKHIDKPGGHGHQSDGSTYDDLNLEEREPPSTYESIGREPAECEEDTADNRRQYESLGTRNDASVYDKLKGPTNNTYENTITRR